MYPLDEPPQYKSLKSNRRADCDVPPAALYLLTVLGVRGVVVPDTARERILAQKDPSLLERWLAKAVVAASVGEVVDEPS